MSTDAQKKAQRKYYQKNRDKIRQWHKEHYDTNKRPLLRIKKAMLFIDKYLTNEIDAWEYDVLMKILKGEE